MKILETLKAALTGPYSPAIFAAQKVGTSGFAKPSEWLVDMFGGAESKSGIRITENNALTCSTVLKCVRILSETIASLPLIIYRRLPAGGKERATDHPLYNLLHNQVNPLMTSFEWRETLEGHLTLWGNGYSEIERSNGGRPLNLWPLRPDKMRVEADGMRLRYHYTVPDGAEVEISEENVLHVKGLSANGYLGQSVIGFIRESVGLALAYEEFGARFFSNDVTPSGFLKHPGKLSDQALQHLKESWNEQHKGLSNKHRMQVLEEGIDYVKMGIPLEDAQFLDLRKYQDVDIAGIYRIPPHMIGNLEQASFSNIEHQAIEFVVHTMRPWLVRWEQAMLRDLFLPRERIQYFVEFLVDGLLRGDTKSRSEALAIQRQWGIINADEWNEIENRNPLPDGQGKIYIVPVNYQTLSAMAAGGGVVEEPTDTPALSSANGKDVQKIAAAPPEPRNDSLNGGEHE